MQIYLILLMTFF